MRNAFQCGLELLNLHGEGDADEARVGVTAVGRAIDDRDMLLLQQLEGAGVTFRCVTSMTVLGKILAQPHIHNHMDKEDARDLGDGIEYVLVLPNGVRIEFVTTRCDFDRAIVEKEYPHDGRYTRRLPVISDTIGRTVETVEGPEASCTMRGDDLYVRAIIVSDRPGKLRRMFYPETLRAWTQPFVR